MVNGEATADQLHLEVEELRRRLAEQQRCAAHGRVVQQRWQLFREEACDYSYLLLDAEGRITDWDDGAARLWGFHADEVLLHPLSRLFAQAHGGRDQARQLLQSASIHARAESEAELLRRDGSRCSGRVVVRSLIDDGDRLPKFFVLVQDITASKQAEAQLQQSQKMESIGRLAGGVAHDFNNLLTVINGYGEMLAGSADLDEHARRLAAEIKRSGERAAALTQQLLAFSRRQLVSPRILDLNAVLRETEKLLRRLIGENIELILDLDPALGPVRADLAQIEQVVINLAVNARDAMPAGGRLTLATRNVQGDPNLPSRHADGQPGRQVLLTVADTGCGMDDTIKSHLFEPFFTTKEVGKGTGLGLSTIFGIIKQSQGHVDVASETGKGSKFEIYLPQCAAEDNAAAPDEGARTTATGHETVLLVEDEPGVRDMARMTLQHSGYTVLAAADGDDALAVYRRHPGPLDLLITDVVMPKIGGQRLAEELSAALPSLKVLYISGYADAGSDGEALAPAAVLLQKPFTPAALAQQVRQLLDR